MKNEWFTPPAIVELARLTLKGFDLDPASCQRANEIVRAARFFTKADNGLAQPWEGRVFLNPPYERDAMAMWCSKFATHPEGIIIVYSNTSTRWYQMLLASCQAASFPSSRIKFWHPDKPGDRPRYDNTIFLRTRFPHIEHRFLTHFNTIGETVLI